MKIVWTDGRVAILTFLRRGALDIWHRNVRRTQTALVTVSVLCPVSNARCLKNIGLHTLVQDSQNTGKWSSGTFFLDTKQSIFV